MSKKKIKINGVGLIVEDESDLKSFSILIKRITDVEKLKIRGFNSKGCGKLRRKMTSYANSLVAKGCNLIIVVHDLDRHNFNELHRELSLKLDSSNAKYKFVCIPIEELEGWLLSDPKGLKTVFNLPRLPKFKGFPEKVSSPKETIEKEIYSASKGKIRYLNTSHNDKICSIIDLSIVDKRCNSFRSFKDEILEYRYK